MIGHSAKVAENATLRKQRELIDRIEVYHAEKQDGVTNQRVDIDRKSVV